MDNPSDSASNSLGLDLEALQIADEPSPAEPPTPAPAEHSAAPADADTAAPEAAADPAEPTVDDNVTDDKSAKSEPRLLDSKEKKKPYVNPERVKTGGAQRDKLSEEELAERMVRIREQNEKIKQRRVDVKADEDAFKKTQEAERARQTKMKKVQENVDRTREQNARRKMDKIQSREWDSGKTRDWKQAKSTEGQGDGTDSTNAAPRAQIGIRGAIRGGGGGRGRGRGPPSKDDGAKATPTTATPPAAPAVTTS